MMQEIIPVGEAVDENFLLFHLWNLNTIIADRGSRVALLLDGSGVTWESKKKCQEAEPASSRPNPQEMFSIGTKTPLEFRK